MFNNEYLKIGDKRTLKEAGLKDNSLIELIFR